MLAVTAGAANLTRAMRSLEALFLIGVEGVTEIWLVRHADAYDGLVDSADPPISERGRSQAQRLAERVSRLGPAAVYSSPFRRAVETARFISEDMTIDDRLVEMDLVLGEDGTFDLKEPPDSAAARMRAAMDDIVTKHAGGRVIAVSHGAAIIACLSDVMQLEPGRLRMLPYFTSVSTVRVLGERRMVGALGDTAHLE